MKTFREFLEESTLLEFKQGKEYTKDEIMKKINDGKWEADNDVTPGKYVDLRKKNGKRVSVFVKENIEVNEAIKGWKHAHNDIAKARRAVSSASKSVVLHALKKDGKESGMHDARKSFGSEEEAVKYHDNLHTLNPGKKFKHNMYIDGVLVKTLD